MKLSSFINIRKHQLVILLLLFGLSAYSQVQHKGGCTNLIEIDSLNEKYISDDTLRIIIRNNKDHIIFYSASFDEKIGEGWVTLLPDIYVTSYDRYEAQNVRILPSDEQKIEVFAIKDILRKINQQPYGLCRISFKISTDLFEDGKTYFTTSFLID